MSEAKKPTHFDKEQLKYLQEQFPVRILSTTATENEVHQYFGTQKVIELIQRHTR